MGLLAELRNREQAVGRICFAGEHASPWPGWMQGAIASGIKAAREINAKSDAGLAQRQNSPN
jgi:monoamine oxidase